MYGSVGCELILNVIIQAHELAWLWLARWTQALKGLGSNRSRDAVGNSLRQTVHTHRASVHQAAKICLFACLVGDVDAMSFSRLTSKPRLIFNLILLT